MRPFLTRALLVWPIMCLLGAAFLLPIIVPEIVSLQTFVNRRLEGVPVFLWSLFGLVGGVAVSFLRSRWPNRTVRYGARALIGFGAWLLFGLLLTAFVGEGSFAERMADNMVLATWAMVAWALVCMAPVMTGVHSILYRSTLSRGAAVLTFLLVAVSGMVYSQASGARVAHQDPFLSLLFVWALIGYVEGINWRHRYSNLPYEPSLVGLLLGRQVGFTLLFMGVGSLAALAPFLLGDWPEGYYESSTVLGKAFVGLLALVPLLLFASVRRLVGR